MTFEELKDFMSKAQNVKQWNDLRDEAKEKTSPGNICRLDGSGFINEVIPR